MAAPAALNLDQVLDLKEIVKERFGVEVHYHDTCGGQSFDVKEMTPELKSYLQGYFDALDLRASFGENDGYFSVAP